jgi:hypothetical protein
VDGHDTEVFEKVLKLLTSYPNKDWHRTDIQ